MHMSSTGTSKLDALAASASATIDTLGFFGSFCVRTRQTGPQQGQYCAEASQLLPITSCGLRGRAHALRSRFACLNVYVVARYCQPVQKLRCTDQTRFSRKKVIPVGMSMPRAISLLYSSTAACLLSSVRR